MRLPTLPSFVSGLAARSLPNTLSRSSGERSKEKKQAAKDKSMPMSSGTVPLPGMDLTAGSDRFAC